MKVARYAFQLMPNETHVGVSEFLTENQAEMHFGKIPHTKIGWTEKIIDDEENRKLEIKNGIQRIMDDSRLITVCDFCLTAACWQGEFMCMESKTAGTTKKTIAELKKLDLEHSDNWEDIDA